MEQRIKIQRSPEKLVNWIRNYFCHKAPGIPEASNELSRAKVPGRTKRVSRAGPRR